MTEPADERVGPGDVAVVGAGGVLRAEQAGEDRRVRGQGEPGVTATACVKIVPRAASASSRGVAGGGSPPGRAKAPIRSARVVSSVTRSSERSAGGCAAGAGAAVGAAVGGGVAATWGGAAVAAGAADRASPPAATDFAPSPPPHAVSSTSPSPAVSARVLESDIG